MLQGTKALIVGASLVQGLADLQQQIHDMHSLPSPLEVVKAKRDEHIADRDTFTKHIQTLQARLPRCPIPPLTFSLLLATSPPCPLVLV